MRARKHITAFKGLLHGGDYNPDQWLHMPEIIDEDFRLMKLAGCNAMSIGIFAWATLEPREGEYAFGWLDDIMDRLAAHNAFAVLATPSGARPAWLAQKYPEVLRVGGNRVRNLFGERHNHCYTSPVYRQKATDINTRLAKRYADHPALLMWHLSNEYGGECHCDLCQAAFREWLKKRYDHDLDTLNRAYWAAFWSHTYSDWSQVESPAPHGENLVHALNLDWKRFVTHQTGDFIDVEAAPLKEHTPHIPITTNFMGTYPGLNYWRLKKHLDVISWDSYPRWHQPGREVAEPSFQAFIHDMCRSFKQQPFMLMESTPSTTNWMPSCKRKRPHMHRTASLQAIAHGSDTVQYFQWRKSRGSCEKLHGAVVDHAGHEHTRVFQDVAGVGEALGQLREVAGSATPGVKAAVIYDWENSWALEDAKGVQTDKRYLATVHAHYTQLWKRGVTTDVIDMDSDFSGYTLLVAPMLYMLRPGVAERITAFVKSGGTLLTTYMSGWVNESDLCFLGGFPGPLRDVLGIWDEETDALYEGECNTVAFVENAAGLSGSYAVKDICAHIHTETAEALATYQHDFLAGTPALTRNRFGKGHAWYLAARADQALLDTLYDAVLRQSGLSGVVRASLPPACSVVRRGTAEHDYLFVMNFSSREQTIAAEELSGVNILDNTPVTGSLTLAPFDAAVVKTAAR